MQSLVRWFLRAEVWYMFCLGTCECLEVRLARIYTQFSSRNIQNLVWLNNFDCYISIYDLLYEEEVYSHAHAHALAVIVVQFTTAIESPLDHGFLRSNAAPVLFSPAILDPQNCYGKCLWLSVTTLQMRRESSGSRTCTHWLMLFQNHQTRKLDHKSAQ